MKKLSLLAPCLTLAAVANAATLTLDFETANQFNDNFRVGRGTAGTTIGQTTALADNYFFGGRTGLNPESVTAFYDTTPGNSGDTLPTFGSGPITIDFNIATANAAQLVGIYLIDSTNVANNLNARFNVNATSENDRINFSTDGNVASGTVGASIIPTSGVNGALNGSAWQSTAAGNGVDNSGESSPVWYGLTLTYTPGTNNDTTLTLAYGASFSATVIILNEDRIDNPALGFYISNYTAGSTTKIDDISISYTTVPEPSSYSLLLGGAVGGFLLCQRKRRA